MLYKRHKNEYERTIMNDDWVEQKCNECKYYSDCININVLPTSNLYFNEFIESIIDYKLRLNQICGIYQAYKGVIESPKILYIL